jgi:imidazolonepropionase-like amidohydrolase
MFLNAVAISAGAVFGRYHYAADALAGWLVARSCTAVAFCFSRIRRPKRDRKEGTMLKRAGILAVAAAMSLTAPLIAQQQRPPTANAPRASGPDETLRPAPNRRTDEGKGPYKTLVIRGAMLIDGTGAPPRGPVDIVVENNRITAIRSAGTPGLPLRANRAPQAEYEVDATGMYVMPGFVDMHVHAGGAPKNADAEYAYKLWLAHGVTTVRGVPLAGNAFTVSEKARSARNEIVAPRIYNYQRAGVGWDKGPVEDPQKAAEWVQWAKQNGVDGLKLGSWQPDIMRALLGTAKALGMGSTAHLDQAGVAQMNAIDAARLGLGTVTHFYGHFESLLKDYVVQPYPVDQNMNDEYMRFGQVARLWDKIYEPGSPEWKAYLQEHLKLGTVFDPTLTIYSAGRDVMRFRNAEWHDKYTLPSLMDFYTPSRSNHGAYWYDWTTEDEVAWRNFYQVWFKLVNDYKKMGGRVTTGSDSGFIYQTYGFGYINELEMLQEAGFHPLEVIQSATMNGALTLAEPGKAPEFGIVRAGMLADMVVVDQNPLQNFKVLYGTGALRLNDKTGKAERVGGIKYTIKDGIVYDAKQLLADVAAMVDRQKKERGAKTNTAAVQSNRN